MTNHRCNIWLKKIFCMHCTPVQMLNFKLNLETPLPRRGRRLPKYKIKLLFDYSAGTYFKFFFLSAVVTVKGVGDDLA